MMTKGSWLDFMHKTSISQFQQTHTNTKKDNLLVFKAEEHVTGETYGTRLMRTNTAYSVQTKTREIATCCAQRSEISLLFFFFLFFFFFFFFFFFCLHCGKHFFSVVRSFEASFTLFLFFSLAAILKRLHERGLHSAPVFDEGKYLGFVDVRDVVTVLLMACSKGKTTEEIAWSDWETDFSRLQIAGQEFGMRCAADVCNASGNNPWIEVSGDGTFEQLCEELVAMKAHRCAIMSEKGALHSVVSASDVLQFIAEHASIWAPQIGERMVGDILDLKSAAAPITIPQDALAVQAFYLMHVQKVSAVGVIGPKGQLVANLSASDLKVRRIFQT
jgi:CBS domain-containing protein